MRAILALASLIAALAAFGSAALAQERSGPLRIEITEGVIEPLPFAIPPFIAENAAAQDVAFALSQVVAADLAGTGLFREIPAAAHVASLTSFDSPVQYSDWRVINAEALITGSARVDDGKLTVKFRVFDVFAQAQLGEGLQFAGSAQSWRRIAHKVADVIYSRITGEGGYFDSRVVFVAESGPKDNRLKQLAIMDYDGANVQLLTDTASIVLAPRITRGGDKVIYTSYETGKPSIFVLDVASGSRQQLNVNDQAITFSPRFSPDGRSVIFSMAEGGNTDIYRMNLGGGPIQRLTSTPAIETAPSFSPDGTKIVFESDRSGTQQLYIMDANGGEATRISFGKGRYGTPVWSPRGDLIAFTKQANGRFHIGVMRTDGSEERLLTASFLDEGPSWSPNGRVVMFTRESQGAGGQSALYSVDITGRNLRRVPIDISASDPAWSPLLP